MNKTITILTLSILLFTSTINAEEEKNGCNDPDTYMQWEAIMDWDFRTSS